MSNELSIFDNSELQVSVRSLLIDEEAWFVAKDICDYLEINTWDLKKILDDDELATMPCKPAIEVNLDSIVIGSTGGSEGTASSKTGSNGGSEENAPKIDNISDMSNGGKAPLIISESGMYHLAFVSRKPAAVAFRRWVTHEVLPTLRKTGEYKMRQELEEKVAKLEVSEQRAWDYELATRNEMLKLREEYMKHQITYPGRYYTIPKAPYNVCLYPRAIDELTEKLNELSLHCGYGIKLTTDNWFAWHEDMWKLYEKKRKECEKVKQEEIKEARKKRAKQRKQAKRNLWIEPSTSGDNDYPEFNFDI